MNNERLLNLILLYKAKELSEDESIELNQWIEESEDNRREFIRLTDAAGRKHFIQFRARMAGVMESKSSVRRIDYTYYFRRMAAIAAVLIIVVAGLYIWRGPSNGKAMPGTNAGQQQAANDVAPGKFKARLKLADGKVIILDSANAGLLAQQGRTNIYSEGGAIKYSPGNSGGESLYNTIETATGETYPVTLSDGTKAWLNSQSSIKFPVAFNGDMRKVEITGEVYFEVAKDPSKPFNVAVAPKESSPFEIQVLGTHFNVNSYEDEPRVKTTLLEGRIAIKSLATNKTEYLKPGQQASLDQKGALKVISLENTKAESLVAWKDQTFQFEKDDLQTVMRQLSRWYGITVSYEGNIPDRSFGGMISRNRNLSQVLKMLESSEIHFKIEDKRLIVRP